MIFVAGRYTNPYTRDEGASRQCGESTADKRVSRHRVETLKNTILGILSLVGQSQG